jgi:hypothetical protein
VPLNLEQHSTQEAGQLCHVVLLLLLLLLIPSNRPLAVY